MLFSVSAIEKFHKGAGPRPDLVLFTVTSLGSVCRKREELNLFLSAEVHSGLPNSCLDN